LQADGWLGGGLCCGTVHEWVGLAGVPPMSVLVHVAACAAHDGGEVGRAAPWLVCIGREVWPTPHAVVRGAGQGERTEDGELLRRMLLIDPPSEADRHWAIELALRCEGLIVIGDASGVDMATSRRLQLAAEAGHSLGLLARPPSEAQAMSVATTRWLVQPVATEAARPRWRVTLARCKGLQSAQLPIGGTQDDVPGLSLARVARGMVTDDRSLLVEVNDAGGVVPVHADIRVRCDPAAAAS
ncbi:MAG TPA: hypothetical protein VK157_14350, partial [Phycisphaerales bacterium]|nr:hypothetical protein [Phycisphaerales bacterium]